MYTHIHIHIYRSSINKIFTEKIIFYQNNELLTFQYNY